MVIKYVQAFFSDSSQKKIIHNLHVYFYKKIDYWMIALLTSISSSISLFVEVFWDNDSMVTSISSSSTCSQEGLLSLLPR